MTIENILDGLKRCYNEDIEDECPDCPYKDTSVDAEGCITELHKDAIKAIRNLTNRIADRSVAVDEMCGDDKYWCRISDINHRQNKKGMEKYGVSLADNATLTFAQRIEHLEEELIDGLKYCEHLKEIGNDGITANDYQRAALRTAGDDMDKYLINAVMGLCGETGEVVDIVKKHLFQGHDLDTEKVAEECGDVLWYAALLASAVGYKLGDIMTANVEKLKKRYPDGFDKARSINRED